MKKHPWITGLAAVIAGIGLAFAASGQARAAALPDGLYVGDENLGGKSWEEAQTAIENHVEDLSRQPVVLNVDKETVRTTARTLGYDWSNEEEIQTTVETYTKGNLIKRFMAVKDLETAPVKLPLEMRVDQEKCAQFVESRCAGFVEEAQNATIVRENGAFVIGESAAGYRIDVEATSKALEEALSTDNAGKGVNVKAVVVADEPSVQEEDLRTIQDVLGTFSTSFASSGAARSANVAVGASKINGRVLMPGETLSGYECMQPFTTENGYETAAAYENGQVVDSIGGGVCQIATTLYNAALQAELTITQRQNHSMTVSYVQPSMDAAIAGTYKDIKITNNYSTPIYVEAGTDGKNLTFTIYGKETRPANRTIQFVSETLGTTSAGEPITRIDNTLAPGSQVTVQSGHDGLKSRLWKYVYVDGVETEKTILHTDTYNASKAIIRMGPVIPDVQVDVPPTLPSESLPQETDPSAAQPSAAPQEPGGAEVGPGAAQQPGSSQNQPSSTQPAAEGSGASQPSRGQNQGQGGQNQTNQGQSGQTQGGQNQTNQGANGQNQTGQGGQTQGSQTQAGQTQAAETSAAAQ